ncbi:MAG: proliferating cell nuclear antigen (pcna) [Candidatus Thorarchaeota archaeon]|nr:proliferating cell nuclear antigen (pcna) [Candidatus Thorarchaeota archaeon]
MFRATLNSSKAWKQIVDAVATLLTEAHFLIKDDGFSLIQYDSSRAAMIDLYLPSSIFQEYHCKGEHNLSLGLDELTKVSKRMAGDDKLEFNLDETQNRFEIRMISQAERTFKIQLLTPPEEKTQKIRSSFEIRAEMFSDTFKQVVKDIGVVSNHMKITATQDSLSFGGMGDAGEAQVSLTLGEDSLLHELEVKQSGTSMYALSYLTEIAKAISSDSLTLRMTENKPVMLEFPIAESGLIKFLLAPRIERR